MVKMSVTQSVPIVIINFLAIKNCFLHFYIIIFAFLFLYRKLSSLQKEMSVNPTHTHSFSKGRLMYSLNQKCHWHMHKFVTLIDGLKYQSSSSNISMLFWSLNITGGPLHVQCTQWILLPYTMHIVDIASIYRILSFGYMNLLFYIRGGLYNKCDIFFALCNTRLKKKNAHII